MKFIKTLTTLLILPAFCASVSLAESAKLKVLIIDGQNNHKWQTTTPVLKEALESSGAFTVTISTSPAKKSAVDAWANWKPNFSAYDTVVSNYNGEMWPEEIQKNFVNFVQSGGGFVSVHAADNAFGKWKEYNEMIGVGGWGGRKLIKDGAWLHVVDGKVVRDTTTTGNGGGHGPRRTFVVEHLDATHPITKGLPEKWLHAKDELYCKLCGPAKNLDVIAHAESKLTKRNEPMLMTIAFGKGRVFHTTLGHDVEAMRCRGFFVTLQRGTEWTATGAVEKTAKVPADFPTADKVSPVAAQK